MPDTVFTRLEQGIQIEMSLAAPGMPETTEYVTFVRRSLYAPAGQDLFGFSAEDLAERKAWIVTARLAGIPHLLGACHFVLKDGELWLRGLLVSAQARGMSLAAAIGAFGLTELRKSGVTYSRGAAAVIVHHQMPNPRSVRALGKLGYELKGGGGVVELKGDFRDRHLFAYSERIDGLACIRYQLLDLPPQRVATASDFLKRW